LSFPCLGSATRAARARGLRETRSGSAKCAAVRPAEALSRAATLSFLAKHPVGRNACGRKLTPLVSAAAGLDLSTVSDAGSEAAGQAELAAIPDRRDGAYPSLVRSGGRQHDVEDRATRVGA
jgi:hypothetical protein